MYHRNRGIVSTYGHDEAFNEHCPGLWNNPLFQTLGGNPPRWLIDGSAPRLDMARAINGPNMLYYALIFLLIALLAGALGFLALAGVAALIARVMFVLFLVLFLLSLVRRRRL